MTPEEFKVVDKAKKIFVFSTNSCYLCKQHKGNMEGIDNINFVDTDDELELVRMNIGAVPYTVVYGANGEIAYKKHGVFYDKQIKEMKDIYDSIHNSKESGERQV